MLRCVAVGAGRFVHVRDAVLGGARIPPRGRAAVSRPDRAGGHRRGARAKGDDEQESNLGHGVALPPEVCHGARAKGDDEQDRTRVMALRFRRKSATAHVRRETTSRIGPGSWRCASAGSLPQNVGEAPTRHGRDGGATPRWEERGRRRAGKIGRDGGATPRWEERGRVGAGQGRTLSPRERCRRGALVAEERCRREALSPRSTVAIVTAEERWDDAQADGAGRTASGTTAARRGAGRRAGVRRQAGRRASERRRWPPSSRRRSSSASSTSGSSAPRRSPISCSATRRGTTAGRGSSPPATGSGRRSSTRRRSIPTCWGWSTPCSDRT